MAHCGLDPLSRSPCLGTRVGFTLCRLGAVPFFVFVVRLSLRPIGEFSVVSALYLFLVCVVRH